MTSVSLDRIASALGMTNEKTPDTHVWATVSSINDDGSYQVQFNGAGTTTRAAKVCNAEVGDRVLCVVSNGQVSAIGNVGGITLDALGGVAIDLLWTNASPTSSFAAQTISIPSIANYDFIMVAGEGTAIAKVGKSDVMVGSAPHGEWAYLRTRTVLVNTNNTITFDEGYAGTSTDTTNCIPQKIYGIKGVN